MCTVISPFVMQKNHYRAERIAVSLDHIAKVIWEKTEPADFLSDTANIICCLADGVRELAGEFELIEAWAEDANVNIIHQRYYGKSTRLDVDKYDPSGPDVLLTSTKPKQKE